MKWKDLEGSGLGLSEVLSQNYPGGNVENDEKPSSGQLVSQLICEPSTSVRQVQDISARQTCLVYFILFLKLLHCTFA